MADKVALVIDKSLAEFVHFEKIGLMDQSQIKQALKVRENEEYKLIKNSSNLVEFLMAIRTEFGLEISRKNFMKIHKELPTGQRDFNLVKRIISLFDRSCKKFPGNFKLIKEYLKFCIQIQSGKLVYKVFFRNLKYFMHDVNFWMILILFEFEVKRNIFKAREVFDKALNLNKDLV